MAKKSTMYIVQGAVIAAIYAVLTLGQAMIFPESVYMTVQFRVSEIMTVLAFFTPAAIPGLTIGCVISNLLSGVGPIDMIIGSLASFLAALTMYALRKVCIKGIPILGLFMPAIFNGILVGAELAFVLPMPDNTTGFMFFLFNAGCVALGELVVLFVLGLPMTIVTKKTGLHEKLFKIK